ncbi:MAG TPA: DUF1028 domain-containing protein [Planctomycetota bacterium]
MQPRALLSLLALLALSARPSATWSIVCVNTKTREVGVATATCLENFNIRTAVPVIFVGEGAGAAQSFVDSTGNNRRLIYFSFRDTEETPAEILARLEPQDPGHETRQYGIVNFAGLPVTFTGSRAGAAASGVVGQVGDVLYAIQGNILTGDEVVLAAEEAFVVTKGDMGQKMMAAMEAARALGGDGRCSCTTGSATSCGVPPPNFTKSAHVGCIVVARIGDTNAGCSANRGCAGGEYYLNLNIARGDQNDRDPVFILQERYKFWRDRLEGRPDGIHSRASTVKALPADGVTERRLLVELRDLDEQPIGHGGATLELVTADGLSSLATPGAVTDLGDGRYEVLIRAGSTPGVDRFLVRVTDALPADPTDVVVATLWPPVEVATIAVPLYTSDEELSAAAGGRAAFVLNRADKPRAPYSLVARLAGRAGEPRGVVRGGAQVLPIPVSPFFPAAPGALDARGRAEATLDVPPAALVGLVGLRLEVTGYVLDGGPLEHTNAVGLTIGP